MLRAPFYDRRGVARWVTDTGHNRRRPILFVVIACVIAAGVGFALMLPYLFGVGYF